MPYCFATDIIEPSGKYPKGLVSLFDFRCHVLRHINHASDDGMIYWIMENAPETKMFVKDVDTSDIPYRNLHPSIDGMTRLEASKKFGLKLSKEGRIIESKWCALILDQDAVHFRLRFN